MMHRSIAGLLFLATLPTLGAADFQGYLADWNCTKRIVKNGAEKTFKNDKSCSLQNNWKRKAYGLITDDKKYFRLDETGNKHAQELLTNSPSRDQLHVVVTGDLNGDLIQVKDISMM